MIQCILLKIALFIQNCYDVEEKNWMLVNKRRFWVLWVFIFLIWIVCLVIYTLRAILEIWNDKAANIIGCFVEILIYSYYFYFNYMLCTVFCNA